MNEQNDPIPGALHTLKTMRWESSAHESKLEDELMVNFGAKPRGMSKPLKMFLVALTVIFVGGLAGAAVTSFFDGWLVEETDLGGGLKNVKITSPDGEVVMDEAIEDDCGIIMIEGPAEGEEVGEGVFLTVQPADGE